jgi:ABC-type uncharacterized transport system substrate-binding protein
MVRMLFALLIAVLGTGSTTSAFAGEFSGKKVLLIDSYNEDYAWSADITRAARSVIDPSGAAMRIVRMDTKNRQDEAYKTRKGLEIKALIEADRPDVVIACDDNASKYVIAPFFRGSDIPVVFCGINWDASKYGFPAKNVTGMLEYNSFSDLLAILHAAGGDSDRVGVLAPDNESERADMEAANTILGIKFAQVRYVRTFAQWKTAYAEMQDTLDMLLVYNNAGIAGWDDVEAARVVASQTRALTGSFNLWMAPYAAIIYARVGSEQGRWAGQAALRILGGANPSDIPVTHNKEDILLVNSRLAGMAKFKLPPPYLQAAAKVID